MTQNVDGLHQAAGSHPVVELHGSILKTRCFAGGHRQDSWPDSPESVEYPPQCPQCKSLLRPDVVWFNESLPAEALDLAFEAAQRCDLLFSIGTSSVVYPAVAAMLE